jgi:S-formylglutathione hydrolase
MAKTLKEISKVKVFGGWQKVFTHESDAVKCKMTFGIYLPPQASTKKLPVIFWLSGLTCTEQNFVTKSGAQEHASKHGVVVVAPDTSPRDCNVEGEDLSWDFGTGAGFYVDATTEKWNTNYRMYSYIVKELPEVIAENFPVDTSRMSIMGHSMGGHGALISFLKNPGMYKSVSAFAPICNPMQCPWGIKAFTGYLGEDREAWKEWDACQLVSHYQGPKCTILADQGTADGFLPLGQLLPDHLKEATNGTNVKVNLRMQEDYDHSYYFISTFLGEHFDFHMEHLKE